MTFTLTLDHEILHTHTHTHVYLTSLIAMSTENYLYSLLIVALLLTNTVGIQRVCSPTQQCVTMVIKAISLFTFHHSTCSHVWLYTMRTLVGGKLTEVRGHNHESSDNLVGFVWIQKLILLKTASPVVISATLNIWIRGVLIPFKTLTTIKRFEDAALRLWFIHKFITVGEFYLALQNKRLSILVLMVFAKTDTYI